MRHVQLVARTGRRRPQSLRSDLTRSAPLQRPLTISAACWIPPNLGCRRRGPVPCRTEAAFLTLHAGDTEIFQTARPSRPTGPADAPIARVRMGPATGLLPSRRQNVVPAKATFTGESSPRIRHACPGGRWLGPPPHQLRRGGVGGNARRRRHPARRRQPAGRR